MTTTERPATMCEAFQRTAAIDPDAVALRTPGGAQTLTWRRVCGAGAPGGRRFGGLGRSAGRHGLADDGQSGRVLPARGRRPTRRRHFVFGVQHAARRATDLPVRQRRHQGRDLRGAVRRTHSRQRRAHRAHRVHRRFAPGTLSVDDLYAAAAADFDFESAWRAVQPDDIVTLIYTSGTTGNPKGVEMTHTNLLFEGYGLDAMFGIEFGDRITSFLPSAHIADRMCCLYLQEMFGTQITVVSDGRAIAAALPDVRPTVWGAVPRVWEKLKSAIEFTVSHEKDDTKRQAMEWAMSVAAKRGDAVLADEPMTDEVAAEWADADELVLSKLREQLGFSELRWAISGAAPIPRETLGFFAGIGIPIAEVWGMSELSCAATASHPRDARLGTVGKLLPGLEGKIADDGEYLVRGPLVMKGYRREPAKTAEAIDADGWLHTGDIFDVDAQGYLRVVDRKKELIINAAGKNMSPANIENAILAACDMVGVMIAIGDGRPYNTALMVFDADSVGPFAARHGLSDASPAALAADPQVIAHIAAGVAAGNAKLSRVEQIKRFRILPTLWEPGGDEITLTMKLKRKPIFAKYAAEIDDLYSGDLHPEVHEPA